MVDSRDVKCSLYLDAERYWKSYEEAENEDLFVRESISDVCFVVKSMQNDPLMGNNSAGGLDEISNADNLWNWFRWRHSLKNAY